MTYGEFLKYCREQAGIKNKSEFARRLGMLSVGHYTGAENDIEKKKPSLELIERAAREAGLEFQDFINPPKNRETPLSRRHKLAHRRLQALLDRDDEVSDWISANITVFYHRFFGGADDAEIRRTPQAKLRK